jgi:hypothetical protein
LRIGAVDNQEGVLRAIERLLGSTPEGITGRGRKYLMPLLGWVREIGDPSLSLRVARLVGSSIWFGSLTGRAGRSPNAVDRVDVARLLTHREAMDLRWALEKLRQAPEEEARAPVPRRGKRRS